MTHFAGENWNGNHLPNAGSAYSAAEVPFPQIWNQEGAATYNDIIGFQDLGAKKSIDLCFLKKIKVRKEVSSSQGNFSSTFYLDLNI